MGLKVAGTTIPEYKISSAQIGGCGLCPLDSDSLDRFSKRESLLSCEKAVSLASSTEQLVAIRNTVDNKKEILEDLPQGII